MKTIRYYFYLLTCLILAATSQAQNQPGIDSTGLTGDNFSLQGALEMFQKASSPEEFEKLLNAEDNHVNNLDLNEDGDIDYIRVIDNSEKNAHAFVLQAIVSETESQDIAVIELEKTGDTTAILQIIGDEDIYGEQLIVEPGRGEDDNSFIHDFNNSVVSGPNAGYNNVEPRIIINVWFWPSVRFVYAPVYVVWHSPWKWHHYPGWWRPWRPFAWHVWHPFHRPYYNHFAVVHTHRVTYAHRIYTPVRVSSVTVRTRHAAAVGNYRVTRTKTTVTGQKGNGVTKTKTTLKGPKGNKATKTTIRRHR
jgi:hypothetical protein